jgi:hypothetical protein
VTADRITDCLAKLDGIADQPVEDQAEILEQVHEALTRELDDLLRLEHPPR